ncbi:MAG: hypothetical protein ABS84_03500 [Rubrivivax sp. SCN 71-131]|nr:MAG: hypothetical protein ABS84_03500 [Rubrivivax sp. SCN 71-131]
MSKTRPAAPTGPARWVGQFVLYGAFALAVGVFSQWPLYHPMGADQAQIKVSISRVGKPVGECRKRSAEELAKMPPNMRAPMDCPRERAPLSVDVELDGSSVLSRVVAPTGLSKDGASSIYERLVVPAGEHRLRVRLNDDVRPGAQTHEREATVKLAAGQVLVIDFDAEKGGITLQ